MYKETICKVITIPIMFHDMPITIFPCHTTKLFLYEIHSFEEM